PNEANNICCVVIILDLVVVPAAADEGPVGHSSPIAIYGYVGKYIGRGIAAVSRLNPQLREEPFAECLGSVLIVFAQGAHTKLVHHRRVYAPRFGDPG